MSEAHPWDAVAMMMRDLEDGALRELAFYLERFPGHDLEIATEYTRLARQEPELDQIGVYRLERAIGQGGQGMVYEALDTRDGTRVAIKLLALSGSPSDSRRRRLQREALALDRLQHPGICPLIDAGDEDGHAYLVMPLLDGQSLEQAIRDSSGEQAPRATPLRFPIQDSSCLQAWLLAFADCADALASAHDAGILHRDVKPGNLMLRPDGSLTLLDFGLARDDALARRQLTRTDAALGTLGYLAPERLKGAGQSTPASDVFALAATLYECLTLQPIRPGQSFAELLRMTREQDPPPLRKLHAGFPSDLERVMQMALARDPFQRYRSAHDLAADLRRIARGDAVQLPRVRWGRRASMVVRQHPLLSLSILLIMGTLAVGWEASRRELAKERQRLLESERQKFLAASRLLAEEHPDGAFTLAYAAVQAKADPASRSAMLASIAALREFEPFRRFSLSSRLAKAVFHEPTGQQLWIDANELTLSGLPQSDGSPSLPRVLHLSDEAWNGQTEDELGGRLGLSDSARFAVAAPLTGRALIWDLEQDQWWRAGEAEDEVRCLCLDESRDRFALGDRRGFVRVHRLSDGAALASWQAHDGYLGWMTWLPDGRLVTGSTGGHREGIGSDRRVVFWQAKESEWRAQHTHGLDDFLSATYSQTEASRLWLASASGRVEALQWQEAEPPQVTHRFQAPNRVHTLSFSHQGGHFLAGYGHHPDHPNRLARGVHEFSLTPNAPSTGELAMTTRSTAAAVCYLPGDELIAIADWSSQLLLVRRSDSEVLWRAEVRQNLSRVMSWVAGLGALRIAETSGRSSFVFPPRDLVPAANPHPVLPDLSLTGPAEPPVILGWLDEQGVDWTLDAAGRQLDRLHHSHRTPPPLLDGDSIAYAKAAQDGSWLFAASANGKGFVRFSDEDEWKSVPLPAVDVLVARLSSVLADQSRRAWLRSTDDREWLLHLPATGDAELRELEFHPTRSQGFHPDGKLARGTFDGRVVIDAWDSPPETLAIHEVEPLASHPTWNRSCQALQFSADGEVLTVLAGPSVITDWRRDDSGTWRLQYVREISRSSAESDRMSYLGNSRRKVASVRSLREIVLLDDENRALDRYRLAPRTTVSCVQTIGEDTVLVGTRSGRILGLRVENDRLVPLVQFAPHQREVMDLRASPDGQQVLSVAGDLSIRVWPLYPERSKELLPWLTPTITATRISGLLGLAGFEFDNLTDLVEPALREASHKAGESKVD